MFLRKSILTATAVSFTVAGAVGQPAIAASRVSQADTATPVRIVSDSGGQRMSIYDASMSPGAQLVADASNVWYPRKTEVWVISQDPNGYFVIKNNASGQCLEPADPNAPAIGMNIVQQPCNSSLGQQWKFSDYAAPSKNSGARSGEYTITPRRNLNTALTVNDWGNTNWSYIVLDHSYAASNRLWMFYNE
ncbi:MAG: RICIN domain-containing protein [Streptosporangiaceae bacterium]|nr:RICIN domain-containing protein [Streptosporangiaceae bacterium]